MLYRDHVPVDGVLVGVVETMFYLAGYDAEHRHERIVPDGSINLVIELDGRPRNVCDNDTKAPRQRCEGSWLSGLHTAPITIETVPQTRLLAVRMSPGQAAPIVGRTVEGLADRVTPGAEIFGDAIATLRQRLVDADDPDAALAIATAWLTDRFDSSLRPPPWLTGAIAALVETPDVNTLAEVLSASGHSQRHFIRVFRAHVGVRPKQFQRILRFQAVINKVHEQQQVQWAQVAAECGYSDQSHLIRDFAHFSGYRPQRFLGEEHDRLNFFPE
ncbi:MAG: helix-turn-helix domain-containing protein [Deltaproteobacteria bacterium]|nr:helix-turn-helix domain-containing protein [Deltaproteobacteria bacterium]